MTAILGSPAMTAPRVLATRPRLLAGRPTHYCPGCGHGVVHRLVADLLGEFGVAERTIAIAPVGCSVFAYDYIDVDWVEAPHGRAPAVATGVRRVRPEAFVLMYQGDGDLAAIGTAEIVHAAARGERITAIFVNNGIYGMTGGQMAQRRWSASGPPPRPGPGRPPCRVPRADHRDAGAPPGRGLRGPWDAGRRRLDRQGPGDDQAGDGHSGPGRRLCHRRGTLELSRGLGHDAQESIDHLQTVAETYPVGVIVDRLKNTTTR